MPLPKSASTRKAKHRDKIARWGITLGGTAVIASVIVILALIVSVAMPLFRSPSAYKATADGQPKLSATDGILQIGIDAAVNGDAVTASIWTDNGTIEWVNLRTGASIEKKRLTPPGGNVKPTLRDVKPLGAERYSLIWSNDAASFVELSYRPTPNIRLLAEIPAEKTGGAGAKSTALQSVARCSDSGILTKASRAADGTILLFRRIRVETPLGDEETQTHRHILRDELIPHIRAMTMDHEGATLYAGTDDGRLIRWRFDDYGKITDREVVRAFSDGRAVTALAMLLGDASLVVGDAGGGITIWSSVSADGVRKLRLFHQMQSQASGIREILPSGRNKSFLCVDQAGKVHWYHATSERQLLSLASTPTRPICKAAFSSRGDAIAGLDARGVLSAWRLEGGSPEISLKTLFGRVHYEGYDTPEYVWQTTGGEDFEPKFSIVPLLFGTIKGTFYAMLFAGPLALFGAIYVSYFTTPWFRKTIKPAVEIMAAVPSVVIGFIVALWLAPILERWIFAFILGLIVVPATFSAFMFAWQFLRRYRWAKRVEGGYEFVVMLPVLLAGFWLTVVLSPPLEAWLFGKHLGRHGTFCQWLFQGPLQMQYDQRNCLIVAFGLGFAVIPIIFSIVEDSLSNVPYPMTAASMALGASRWQTLRRVVLPSASPGLFAAVMIGFGRAVGETMIVLMATGNTPILDWSPLNGMRTLSANIAVEISEAPEGGTLYRVLFLCAVLLFALTFAINTVAEIVRQRLRRKYGKY